MSVPIFNGNPHIPSALNVANSHRYTNTYKSNTFIVHNSVLGNLFSTGKKNPKAKQRVRKSDDRCLQMQSLNQRHIDLTALQTTDGNGEQILRECELLFPQHKYLEA